MANFVYFNTASKLETDMERSRPLCPVFGEENAHGGFSYERIAEHSTQDEAADVESGLIISNTRNNENETEHCETRGSYNILASGKLFRYLTKAIGLWNPCKKHYATLCLFVAILNILSMLAQILIPSICGPFIDDCVTSPRRVTNVTQGKHNVTHGKNNGSDLVTIVDEIALGFDVWNALADTVSYILLINTCWRMQQHLPSMSLNSAQTKVTSCEWLAINAIQFTCSLAIIVVTSYQVLTVPYNKMKFYATYGTGVVIVYITVFTCSSVFAVWACALGRLTDLCFRDICSMTEGNVNDVTVIHQKLCKQLANASHSLKPWFVAHWVLFGIYCIAVFVFDSRDFAVISRKFSGPNAYFMAIVFTLNFVLFLMPCVYASRVTWKCEKLLYRVNIMTAGDWNEGHPFRVRANVNEFIFYAERSKCGFKVGSITFGSSGTWISVLLGILGVGVRLAAYIQ